MMDLNEQSEQGNLPKKGLNTWDNKNVFFCCSSILVYFFNACRVKWQYLHDVMLAYKKLFLSLSCALQFSILPTKYSRQLSTVYLFGITSLRLTWEQIQNCLCILLVQFYCFRWWFLPLFYFGCVCSNRNRLTGFCFRKFFF